jgi:LmbE family N-acetylglucosaminyl deacetylase
MKFFYLVLYLLISTCLLAQPQDQPDAAEILHKLQKLKVLGSVLYVAAHPDDENTRLIAWLANEKKVQTAYLSLTRGDGGQNLLGPEIREQLGIIRTQELLSARRIDKGKQFFTRANDFGYSKSAEETFKVWDQEKILSDVVWVIRKFRPDVIITRFPATGEGGHGHHTASAILAQKAFDLAGNKKAYPEQLQFVEPWQPVRLMLNTGRWWNPDMTGEEPGVITIDVGAFNPLLGISYTEMSALSRSQHKSQGFGSTGSRGTSPEYLEPKKGKQANKDLFDGIDIGWSRVNSSGIEDMIDKIIKAYNPLKPEASIKSLIELRKEVQQVENHHWKEIKTNEIDEIIKASLGLYIEAVASDPYLVPSEDVNLTLELTNRSSQPVEVISISWPQSSVEDSLFALQKSEDTILRHSFKLDPESSLSTPYWLIEKPAPGYYQVNDQQLIGKAENDPVLEVNVEVSIMGTPLSFAIPVEYKWNDPVKGEVHRPLAIVPPVALSFQEEIYLFPNRQPKKVLVKVKNFSTSFKGNITLDLPKGWKKEPEDVAVEMNSRYDEQEIAFMIYPPEGETQAIVKALANSGEDVLDKEVDEIIYDHIPVQTLVTTAAAEFIKLQVQINGDRIGYIEGAGDAIPSTLKELGYQVDVLNEEMIRTGLDVYDAIVVGIRALNTNERIGYMMDDLLSYVHEGGTLVIQYNTSFRLKTENFAPYPLQLSRDRVTVEETPVKILAPEHPSMNHPNKISGKDFEKWVQERGLYFPDQWNKKYVPVLEMSDPGEKETQGSLLIAPYGKGYYVYSGISWFRQLPAGVPGAIRIFVNLLSLSNYQQDAK